jgi:hypothetical protein
LYHVLGQISVYSVYNISDVLNDAFALVALFAAFKYNCKKSRIMFFGCTSVSVFRSVDGKCHETKVWGELCRLHGTGFAA